MSQVKKQKIVVIIPVYNEEGSIAKVLDEIPRSVVNEIVVIDNGSSDRSVEIAQAHHAVVLHEPKRGYGAACLKGIQFANDYLKPDIVIFIDGDYSDYPEDIVRLIGKIDEGYDFVLGSRILGIDACGAQLPTYSVVGNKLAAFLLRILFRGNYTDLGPFRAIRLNRLNQLRMQDLTYGWTIEMQIKALYENLKIIEIPVRYRARYSGKSKVSGNLWGGIRASVKIISTILFYFLHLK
jgi:glycosyltransferase involved in cell wall biosynthesis